MTTPRPLDTATPLALTVRITPRGRVALTGAVRESALIDVANRSRIVASIVSPDAPAMMLGCPACGSQGPHRFGVASAPEAFAPSYSPDAPTSAHETILVCRQCGGLFDPASAMLACCAASHGAEA